MCALRGMIKAQMRRNKNIMRSNEKRSEFRRNKIMIGDDGMLMSSTRSNNRYNNSVL